MLVTSLAFSALLAVLAGGNGAAALTVDLTSEASIKSTAATIAYDMMTFYKGNVTGGTLGQLPGPPPNPSILNAGYFWWESGAMWGTLIDYWYYTGDTTYNSEVINGILAQTGPNLDFLPSTQTLGMGNDDQAFWGMATMTAAELGFPNPPAQSAQWLALAQAVFNTQTARFDNECGGGLHWQAYTFLNGYDYKNSIANGCYFNIAARLARYTGNDTYAQHAISTWDWVQSVKFMDDQYNIYDGAHVEHNCTDIALVQYSYNAAVFLQGAATMYNYTNGSDLWRGRVEGILDRTIELFFPNGIAYEISCEDKLTCNIDMFSFKAYLTRWMAASTKLAPFITDKVTAVLKTSAAAAALQCSGGDNGRMCGLSWSKGAAWDGTSGVGQQMAALEVIQSNLIPQSRVPLTNSTGGTSVGNPNAGAESVFNPNDTPPATNADRAGAGIVTVTIVVATVSMFGWMVWER